MIARIVVHLEAKMREAMNAGDWPRVEVLSAQLDAESASPVGRSCLGAALWYAEQGLPVFAAAPLSKIPRPRTKGVLDATCDPELIASWWAAEPRANVAIATGHGVNVFDFDGEAAHAAWNAAGFVVPVLGTVSTPRAGGFHLYTPATPMRNKAGLLTNLDHRGLGGYVLAPPSATEAGTYRFLRPLRPTGPAYA